VSLSGYIKKRLIDLLEEKRVVVWYDGENAFGDIAKAFATPNTAIVISEPSRLRARREADELLSRLNDQGQSIQVRSGNLLIYCPWARGRGVDERLRDPFESFALLGTAFGDKEVDTFQSLARQAMPERSGEINRLFAEGVPTLALIEGLGENVRYPLLQEALGSDSPIENTAQLLCRDEAAKKLAGVAGAGAELLRSLQSGLGFVPPPRITALESVIEHLGRYVLFSEFALSLAHVLPDQLSGVPRAAVEYRDAIFTLCDRMRGGFVHLIWPTLII
jgi:hypothetical protein